MLRWLAVAGDGLDESALGKGFPDPCRGRSLGRPAPFEPMKLPSEACILRQSARQLSAASGAPPSHPIKSSFAGIGPTASQGLRWVYQCAGRPQSPLGALLAAARPTRWTTTAERARAPPQPLLMVAKCSVIMGGQLVSRRRLFGCSGPKSGSAGSSWRPQLTQISAAPQTMTPVLQDKPRHSTDLAELCSLILWSALFPFRS